MAGHTESARPIYSMRSVPWICKLIKLLNKRGAVFVRQGKIDYVIMEGGSFLRTGPNFLVKKLEATMIIKYCQKAIESPEYKKRADGSWFADLNGFHGIWANGDSVEQCRNELVMVLEEWFLLKMRDGGSAPDVAGLKVAIREIAVE